MVDNSGFGMNKYLGYLITKFFCVYNIYICEMNDRFNLLIIDPQNDFIDLPYEGSDFGRLPVVGSNKDMPRISNIIEQYQDKINKIFVSLDTHTIFHIGHRFWREIKEDGSEGNIAPPGTTFSVKSNIIKGSDGKTYEVNVSIEDRPSMNAYAISYLNKVINEGAADGRNLPCTWAVHCIQGTNGWKVNPTLQNILDKYSDKVEYHIKGQNQLAEMYSIMKAEIPYENVISSLEPEQQEIVKKYVYNPIKGDIVDYNEYIIPSTDITVNETNIGKIALNEITTDGVNKYDLKTTFNDDLFNSLTENNSTILVCGEALSHCVQFSTRDIVKEIENKKLSNKVYLIQNASSYVNMDAFGLQFLTNIFKESSNYFIEAMKCNKLEENAFTGTMEYVIVDKDNVLRPVPCVQSTLISQQKAAKGRNLANSFRGGMKTKRRRNTKSKKSKKSSTKKHRKTYRSKR